MIPGYEPYSCVAFPIGLFPTAQDALDFAADNPPVPQDDLPDDSTTPLGLRWREQSFGTETLGIEANNAPCGYTIQEFKGTAPGPWALVQPYRNRDPVLPKEAEETKPIDPEQELEWV